MILRILIDLKQDLMSTCWKKLSFSIEYVNIWFQLYRTHFLKRFATKVSDLLLTPLTLLVYIWISKLFCSVCFPTASLVCWWCLDSILFFALRGAEILCCHLKSPVWREKTGKKLWLFQLLNESVVYIENVYLPVFIFTLKSVKTPKTNKSFYHKQNPSLCI